MKYSFKNPWHDPRNQYSSAYYNSEKLLETDEKGRQYFEISACCGPETLVVENDIPIALCVTVAGAKRHLAQKELLDNLV